MKRLFVMGFVAFVLLLLVACGGIKGPSGSAITGSAIRENFESLEEQLEAGKKSCTDSDKGINSNIKGSVSGLAEDIYEYTDMCAEGTKFLVEYYCEGVDYKDKTVKCLNGCSAGKCD